MESKINKIVGTNDNPVQLESGQVIINKKSTKKYIKKLVEINEDGENKTTTDGTDGGILKGKPHYDKNGNPTGGIPAKVDGERTIEVEGDEFVVNKEASEKHWKELSKINTDGGNGVPINKPSHFDDDPQEYKKGGKIIEFNPNHVPPSHVIQYALKIKNNHPKIWKLGGNIFGNEAFENLYRAYKRGYWLDSEEWMYIKWRSYVARHKRDFRIEGVIAMLKWADKVEKGWSYMKNLIQERIDKSKAKKKFNKGGLIAPNGKKSNLTPEQYKLVRTPEFKKWFGDWENDPESASKVVDENGEPMVVYHGTDKEFNIFDETRAGELETIEGVDRKIGIYFTNKKSVASFFTKNKGKILSYFVIIKNPFKTKLRELSTFNIKFNRELGSDGVIWNRGSGVYVNGKEYPLQKGDIAEIEYIVFKPNQIKLADGSNTTFDGDNPDIRFKDGGNLENSDLTEITINRVYSGEINSDDGAIFLDENGIEVNDDLYDRLRDAEKSFSNKNRGLQVGDTITVKGKNGNSDFKGNFRGFTNEGKLVVVYGGGNQMVIGKDDYYENGGNLYTNCIDYIKNSEAIKNNGYYSEFKNLNVYVGAGDKIVPKEVKNLFLITYNSSGQKNLKAIDTINSKELANELAKLLKIEIGIAKIIVSEQAIYSKRFDIELINSISDKNIVIADRDKIVCENISNIRFSDGGGIKELKKSDYKSIIAEKQTEKANELRKKLISEGFKGISNPHSSKTDFGVSTYFIFYDDFNIMRKFRISDHSVTNIDRIWNEYHYTENTDLNALVDRVKSDINQAKQNNLERNKLWEADKEKTNLADKKWDEIKSYFVGLTFKHNDRTYQNLEEFSKNKNRSNIYQESLGTNKYGEEAFYYEWTEPIKPNEMPKLKPSREYIEQYKNDGLTSGSLYHLGGDMSKHLAPNGKPSNLTHEQWHLVRTPEFKKWFGDWENDAENSSKVVDSNGEPMVLYRGNREQIGYEFTLGHNLLKKPTINNFGHFFTPDIWVAKRYAEDFMQTNKGYILEVFLNAKNILDLTELGHNSLGEQFVDYLESKKLEFGDYEELINEVRKYEGNYDEIDKKYYSPTIYDFFDYYPKLRDFFIDNNINGIKFLERSRGGGLTYVAFESNQIKLADGTNTTFDSNNPDIRFDEGGMVNVVNSKSLTIEIGSDLYKVQYQRNERGDTDKNVWFANVVSKNGETIENGHLCYDYEYTNVIYGFSLYEVEKDIVHTFKENSLYLIIQDDYGLDIEVRHIDFSNNSDIRFDNGGEVEDLISKGIVELKMFDTTPEHAKEYDIIAKKPLYVQNLVVSENKRLQGIGNKVLQYLESYAQKNGNDVIFGYVASKSSFSKDSRQTFFSEVQMIKNWLHNKGYAINDENNYFHKVINSQKNPDIRFEGGGGVGGNVVNPMDIGRGLDNKDFIEYNGIFSKTNATFSDLSDLLTDDVRGKRGYFMFWKDRISKIEMMPPQEYLKRVREGFGGGSKDENIFESSKKEINEAIDKGYKIDMPHLKYDEKGRFSQEGRNRAVVSIERGEKLIPVLIETVATKNDLIKKSVEIISEANKDINSADINKVIEYAGSKFNLHHDVIGFLEKNKSNPELVKAVEQSLKETKEESVEREATVKALEDVAKQNDKELYKNNSNIRLEQSPYIQDNILSKLVDVFREQSKNLENYVKGIATWKGDWIFVHKFEKAGDIFRELSKLKNDFVEDGYLLKNIHILSDYLKGIDTGTKIESSYGVFAKENKEYLLKFKRGWENQPVITEAQQHAKNLVLSVIDDNKVGIKNELDYFKKIIKDKSIYEANKYDIAKLYHTDKATGKETPLTKAVEQALLIAPNGNKSNLTPEQYKLVRTPEFKAWFGDWENDPKNSSKVVDENGEPMVVYHGTDKEFNIFDETRAGELETIEGVDRKIGIYFTNKKSVASFFTKNKGKILSYFVIIKNPFKTKLRELSTFNIKFNRELGSDGVIWNRGSGVYVNGKEYPLQKGDIAEIEYIVFKPNQIKLADGTNTTFDGENSDIRFEEGGGVGESTSWEKMTLASSRFKPVETIIFNPPLIGNNGAKLVSYSWAYEMTMQPNWEGELVGKRVSDWTQAEISAETGRGIVHQYTIQLTDGTFKTVSSESVPILMGYVDRTQAKVFGNLATASKTLAKQQMKLSILEAQKKEYDELYSKFEKAPKPEITLPEISDLPFVTRSLIQEQNEKGKEYRLTYFKMGDALVSQDNQYIYETQNYIKTPISRTTIESLKIGWIYNRVEEAGGVNPRELYDLKNRVARQKRKVEQMLKTPNMENGGTTDDFDYMSLFNISAEDKEKINQEIKKSEEQEKEDWYQSTNFSKKWASTYQDAINKTVKEYLDAKATYEDWGSRQYKENKGMVFLGGDDIFGQAKSIGSINEGRRRNVLKGAKMQMDEAIETLKELKLSDEEISNLLENKLAKGGGITESHEDLESRIYKEQFGI